MNEDKRINFGMFYINPELGWGYEVIDTIEKETLKRAYGYGTLEEAREAGRKEAIRMVREHEND